MGNDEAIKLLKKLKYYPLAKATTTELTVKWPKNPHVHLEDTKYVLLDDGSMTINGEVVIDADTDYARRIYCLVHVCFLCSSFSFNSILIEVTSGKKKYSLTHVTKNLLVPPREVDKEAKLDILFGRPIAELQSDGVREYADVNGITKGYEVIMDLFNKYLGLSKKVDIVSETPEISPQ